MAGGPVRENGYMYPTMLTPTQWCSDLQLINSIAILVLQLIGGIIMIARVYAFYNKDRRILGLLVVVAVICVGISGVSETANSFTGPGHGVMHSGNSHFVHCLRLHQSQLQQFGAHIRHWTIAWGSQLVFDVLVFTLTFRKLIRARSLGKWSYMALSLRDGGAMTAMNVANIVAYLVPYERSMLAPPTNMLCAVMISRLMLNLRDLEPWDVDMTIRCVQCR
ncbi:hypothetical protein EDD17DRAFT_1548119 [Pisolithus thermaeus]|nr:hypothetical protein EDD17DRAFT_1548119 [Pisolithus thermaeus]